MPKISPLNKGYDWKTVVQHYNSNTKNTNLNLKPTDPANPKSDALGEAGCLMLINLRKQSEQYATLCTGYSYAMTRAESSTGARCM